MQMKTEFLGLNSLFIRASLACNFIKRETLAQVFSCEFWAIFKNTFFTEHLRTTASASFITTIKLKNNLTF